MAPMCGAESCVGALLHEARGRGCDSFWNASGVQLWVAMLPRGSSGKVFEPDVEKTTCLGKADDVIEGDGGGCSSF